jgi:hypothetical protein
MKFAFALIWVKWYIFPYKEINDDFSVWSFLCFQVEIFRKDLDVNSFRQYCQIFSFPKLLLKFKWRTI